MSATTLALLALAVSALGNVAQFGIFLIHCRRDKREFSKRPVPQEER